MSTRFDQNGQTTYVHWSNDITGWWQVVAVDAAAGTFVPYDGDLDAAALVSPRSYMKRLSI